MMRKYFIYSILICASVLGIFFIAKATVFKQKFVVMPVVSEALPATPITTVKPFVILVVPGHDTDTGGAQYRNLYERKLVVDVANDISTLLSGDPKYKVIVARDKQSWNPILANYFLNTQAILDFKNEHQTADKLLIASGQEKIIPDAATHTTADAKTAIELYGINKWANENDVDLIIHVHFNISPRKNSNLPGTYHGFNIFIPDNQRVNAAPSRAAAEVIYDELQKKFAPETTGNQYNSLYTDQGLIALGASNTLTKPAMLIEYAYLYEKMLQTDPSRTQALEQMAEQTVAGIKDYFNSVGSTN
jgi:N-acetylmuramoyl-L-alanine amidase